MATLSLASLATVSGAGGARQVLKPGDPLSLSLTPKAQAALSYQWYKDNRPLAGETKAMLSRDSVGYADAGVYSVQVSDGSSSQYLNLFVAVAPTTTQIIPIGDLGDDAKAAFCDSVTDAIAVSCGDSQILALRRDGTVVSSLGASSVPSGLSDVVALAPGGASCVMKSDGTIVSWANGVVQTSDLGNIVSLEGLWPDGTLDATGGGTAYSASGIVAASSNPSHGLAVKADGTVVAWGPYSTTATMVPAGLTGCVAVAAGDYQSLALRADGTVAAWGGYFYFNAYGGVSFGEGQVPAGLSNVTAIAAGSLNSLALRADGSVVVWGEAKYEVYSNLANVFSIAAGGKLLLTLRDATAGRQFGIRHYAPAYVFSGGWAANSSVSLYGASGSTYQWYKDGVAIPGATSAKLIFFSPKASDVGSYQVAITMGGVTWWSTAVTPSFYQGTSANPFGSLSSRCFVGTGDSVAVPAFVLAQPSIVLIRTAGPSLAQFGVSGLLAKPELTLFDSSGKAILSNQGWKTAPTYLNGTAPDGAGNFDTNFDVGQVAYAVGAFPYDSDQDAAIAVRLPAGTYTAQVRGSDGGTGNALTEVYLYRPNSPQDPSLRFTALSTRCYVGQGDSVSVTGLNVEINSVVLLRAVGPTLAGFGIGNVLAKPTITVFDGKGAVVATNTGWRTNADSGALVSQVSALLGEFTLASSDDSALVLSLKPGPYTVEVKGADGGSGNALVEAYFAANGTLSGF